jgi:hypothetical protein
MRLIKNKIMINNKTILLLTMVLAIATACTNNQNDKHPKNAEELLTRYFESVGGYKNIKAIETKIVDGHYIEPGYNLLLSAHMEYKRPYYRMIGDTAKGFAEGFDGKSWEYQKAKGFYRSEGEAEKATLRGAEFDESFIDYKDKGYNAEFKGLFEIESQDYYELVLKYPEGDVKRYFFDTEYYLPRYMSKTMPLHAVGEPIDYLVTITDYRTVGKVLFPFSRIERNIKTGQMVNSTLIDTIILNREIPMVRFSPEQLNKK